MKKDRSCLRPFADSQQVQTLVRQVADQLKKAYSQGPAPVMIVVLKGSVFFAADLARALEWDDLVMDFVKLASYHGTQSSGTVRILQDLSVDITGKDVLIVEEIVDTGRTLDFLIQRLKASNPKSVRVCALFDKEIKRERPIKADFYGQKVDDLFLIGYGLDLDEHFRSLGAVYVYNP